MCHLTGWHALATKKLKSYFRVQFGNRTNIYLTDLFATVPLCFISFLNTLSDMRVSHLALRNMIFMHFFSYAVRFLGEVCLEKSQQRARKENNRWLHSQCKCVSLLQTVFSFFALVALYYLISSLFYSNISVILFIQIKIKIIIERWQIRFN